MRVRRWGVYVLVGLLGLIIAVPLLFYVGVHWTIWSMSSAQMREMRGNIRITGDVVDDLGKPITGVTMTVEVRRPIKAHADIEHPHDWETRTIEQTVSGSYSFAVDDWAFVSLTFRKNQYYHASLRVDAKGSVVRSGRPSPVVAELIESAEQANPSAVLVVMERIQPSTLLKRYHAEAHLVDPSKVYAFRLSDGESPRAGKTEQAEIITVDDATNLPEGAIILQPDRLANGQFDLIKVRGGNVQWDLPRRMTLTMRGEGNGLISVPIQYGVDEMAGMNEAPSDGYQTGITLGIPDYRPGVDHGGRNFPLLAFYVRIGGKYGKGSISLYSRERKVDVGMGIMLQPDGSTNLRTARQ